MSRHFKCSSDPKQNLGVSQVYAITQGEVDLDTDEAADARVIIGKVKLMQHMACALFDFGASRSFVSYDCVRRCKLNMEPLSRRVLVAIPDMKVVGYTRMDWLSRHYTKTDCRRREVVFDVPSKDRISYMGKTIRLILSVVLAGQVKKSMLRGAAAYLVVMVSPIEEFKGVKGISMIEDFPEVFDDDLFGLASDRETEFVIELEPATSPVHKAPYRMTLTELKELKV
ncbi:uncharacterized protein LOC122282240 [Carya illinoinensis]|uniref:uncharacterized protein LOC122282240 n=1 Tax=Carya illinoinensis TaxID=32201 RepID=UPI001C726EA6|nr:uncharacterized protein LOC122282240 [Carya illinoinensis]